MLRGSAGSLRPQSLLFGITEPAPFFFFFFQIPFSCPIISTPPKTEASPPLWSLPIHRVTSDLLSLPPSASLPLRKSFLGHPPTGLIVI